MKDKLLSPILQETLLHAGNRKAVQAAPFSSWYLGSYHALPVGWPVGSHMYVYTDFFHVHKDSTRVSATVSYQRNVTHVAELSCWLTHS